MAKGVHLDGLFSKLEKEFGEKITKDEVKDLVSGLGHEVKNNGKINLGAKTEDALLNEIRTNKKISSINDIELRNRDMTVRKDPYNLNEKKFNFTRYEGKSKNIEVKNPLSQEFQKSFEQEYGKQINNNNFKINDMLKTNLKQKETMNALYNINKNGKFDGDMDKLFKMNGAIGRDSSALRNAVNDNRVNFDRSPSKFQQGVDKFLKKAVPVAVGGGLIFSMFNRGGQMSNSELYGQQQQYSSGY